jgi:Flp pilus assembly protein TadD
MRYSKFISLGSGLLALSLAVLPLAGCTSSMFGQPGSSAFGSAQASATDLPNVDSYSAKTALVEARNHFRNSDFGYSAALYKRLVELSPKNPEGYIGLGASYDRLGRFDLSDRVYGSLFVLTGGTAQYYNNVGYSYMLRGNLTAALGNFRKAIKLDPNNLVVANNMQIIANATGGHAA